MIKHLVFCNLKNNALNNTKEHNANILKEKLLELTEFIPELKHMECGANIKEAPAAFDFALYSEFENEADLEIYQNHPKHVEVKEFIGKIATDRAFVDYTF